MTPRLPADTQIVGRLSTGPLTMLMLSFCGMMVGLSIDLQSVLPQTITTLCLGSHSFVAAVIGHSTLLPVTSLLMFASGFVVLGLGEPPYAAASGAEQATHMRYGFTFGCNFAMLAGMFLGEWLGPRLAAPLGLSWTLGAMIAAMVVGMGAGMVAWTLLHRVAFLIASRSRPLRSIGGRVSLG